MKKLASFLILIVCFWGISNGQGLSIGIDISSNMSYSKAFNPSINLNPNLQLNLEKRWNTRINTIIGISWLNVGMFGTTICQAGPCPDQTKLRYNIIEIPFMVKIGLPYELAWRERIKLVLGYSFGIELTRTAKLKFGDEVESIKIEDNKRENHIINAGFEINLINSENWYLAISLMLRAVDYQYSTFDLDFYPYLGIRISKRVTSIDQ